MIVDALLATLFVGFIGVVLYVGFGRLFRDKNHGYEREAILEAKQPEAYATDKWVFVEHRGIILPMREHEKINMWDTMNREGRNEQVDAMKKAIKRGKVTEYYPFPGACLYVPKGADLIKIRDQYIAFKKGDL